MGISTFAPAPYQNQGFVFHNAQVDIWLCYLGDLQDQGFDYFSLLSTEEKSRAERFKFDLHRKRFILSHGFVRQVLACYLKLDPAAIAYQQGAKGKPYLQGTIEQTHNMQFNLSHTQDIALLAVSQGIEVGIDIEHMERKTDWQGICKRFYTIAEQKALFSLETTDKAFAFFELWTRKEAYMKVLGTGLSLSPTEFTLTVPPTPPALLKHHSKKIQPLHELAFINIALPERLKRYKASLAVASKEVNCNYYLF